MIEISFGITRMCSDTVAYIDPATTSYFIQIITGVVIAVGTFAGIFWSKLRRKFKKNKNDEPTPVSKNNKGKGGVITADDLMSDDDDK
ncbi:hypothetical protein [Ruminococcus sp. HUN007]|uniref:hypothetical protein n=1 Tax=Ruminococcus sp. HUN007 TaxID=1514668 RepID=UPI0005D28576|nr:hypothetical protein [Ruminococcus sp. HUN007]